MDWALVIYEGPEMAEAICGALARGLRIPAHSAANLAEAEGVLKQHDSASCKLIVASFTAPANDKVSAPLDRVEPDAVAFLRKARALRNDDFPACIFTVSTTDPVHDELLRGLKNVELLALELVFTKLCDVARALAYGGPKALPSPLDINITLTANVGRWHLLNKQRKIDRVGALKISREHLKTMLLYSSLVGALKPGHAQEMSELIHMLSMQLYQCLTGNPIDSDKLGEHIFHATERLTMLESTRLRFEVDAATSSLIVEALAYPGAGPDEDDLWMLKLPIFRKFGGEGGRKPLFKDGASRIGPVKCLLIEGETEAFNGGGEIAKRFGDLAGARTEIAWIKAHLDKHCEKFCLAPPTLLRARDHAPGEFAGVLRDTLRSEHWQLIHYSGHSEPGSDKRAYLVLGGRSRDLFDVDLLARYADDVQFVFLNSCSSANANFIQRLAEGGVPAVAGYAWPIPDQVAANFSRKFYQYLFPEKEGGATSRFLEFAFMRARADLYTDYRGESLWMAPLLFMQTLEREEDTRSVAATGAIS
jgi:hypothetical protein